jgi:hypothetical protein
MSEEIFNKVQKSGLIQLDLNQFDPNIEIVGFDLKEFLFEEIILKEKEFRLNIENINLLDFLNKGVYVFCSVDVIIPSWAYMLVVTKLNETVTEIIKGTKQDLERYLLMKAIDRLNLEDFKEKKVILKGCSKLSESEFALTYLTSKLQKHVSSLMFGEPCSTVPIFKRKK